jgi:hypothetical protein
MLKSALIQKNLSSSKQICAQILNGHNFLNNWDILKLQKRKWSWKCALSEELNRIRASLNLGKFRAIYRDRGSAESWGNCLEEKKCMANLLHSDKESMNM